MAEEIATKQLGVQHQVDTYFHCTHGRLKLRQIDGHAAQLIAYERPDDKQAKASDYRLVPVANPETLKQALTAALGVKTVVEKRREVFLYQNVRIHLDDVTGLGSFLEFEAVLGTGIDDAKGHAQLEFLRERFGIGPDDLLEGSYSDLLEA